MLLSKVKVGGTFILLNTSQNNVVTGDTSATGAFGAVGSVPIVTADTSASGAFGATGNTTN